MDDSDVIENSSNSIYETLSPNENNNKFIIPDTDEESSNEDSIKKSNTSTSRGLVIEPSGDESEDFESSIKLSPNSTSATCPSDENSVGYQRSKDRNSSTFIDGNSSNHSRSNRSFKSEGKSPVYKQERRKKFLIESSSDDDSSLKLQQINKRKDYRQSTAVVIDTSESEEDDKSKEVLISSDSEGEDMKFSTSVRGNSVKEEESVSNLSSRMAEVKMSPKGTVGSVANLSSSMAEVKLSPKETNQPGPSGNALVLNDYSSAHNSLIAEEAKLRYQVAEVLKEVNCTKEALKNSNLAVLPDKGVLLKMSLKRKEEELRDLRYQQASLGNKLIQLQMQSGTKNKPPTQPQQKLYSLPSTTTDLHAMGRQAM